MVKPLRKNPSFFKVMIGDYLTTLRIPPLFKKHLGAKIRDESVLRSPGGGKWYVKIERENGDCFFRDGWETFVSDHSVSLGDFLIFIYDGDMGFNVKIFGKSGCEKENPPESQSTGKKKVGSGNPSEIFIDSLPADQDKVSATSSERRKPDFIQKKSNLCYKIMRGSSKITNKWVLKAACSFKCTHPHFVAACRKSRSSYMTIPTTLVREYGLAKKDLVMLQDPTGILWPVKVTCWSGGRLSLSSGWSNFYKGNCLKEGDVCVFELVQGGEKMHVHIFRVEEYTAESFRKSGESIQSGKRALTREHRERVLKAANSSKTNHSEFGAILCQSERVLKAANSFKTRHSKFVSLWRQCRLYCMPISKILVKELDLKTNRRTIIHDPCGLQWPVEITCRSGGRVDLGIGWSNFCKGNNLCEGDACVFEFFQGADAIKAHIFRVGENADDCIGEQSNDQIL